MEEEEVVVETLMLVVVAVALTGHGILTTTVIIGMRVTGQDIMLNNSRTLSSLSVRILDKRSNKNEGKKSPRSKPCINTVVN